MFDLGLRGLKYLQGRLNITVGPGAKDALEAPQVQMIGSG